MAGFPKPPNTALIDASALVPEDVSFILDTCLRPDHRVNAEVLRFINSYVQCRDIAQAAKEAKIPTMRAKAMMKRKDIFTAINKITDTALMKYGLDPNEIVEKVKEIAFFDPASLCNPDGSFIENLHDIKPEARRAIKKFTAENIYDKDPNGMPVIRGRLIKVEFWDKLRGNELLGREKDLFKETTVVEHEVSKNMKEVLLESKARAEQRALEARRANEKPVLEITAPPGGSQVGSGPVEELDDSGDSDDQ